MKKLFLSILILMLAGMLAAQTRHAVVRNFINSQGDEVTIVNFGEKGADSLYLSLKPKTGTGGWKEITLADTFNLLDQCGYKLVTSTARGAVALFICRKEEK